MLGGRLSERLPTSLFGVAHFRSAAPPGTVSRLLTDEGYVVDGLDFSPQMIQRARAKVPESRFVVADAATPSLPVAEYDVVFGRHVLWAMSEPEEAFARWVSLLKPGGVAVLVEGNWSTGAGLTAANTAQIVPQVRDEVHIKHLPEPVYWGKAITDERYLAISLRTSYPKPV